VRILDSRFGSVALALGALLWVTTGMAAGLPPVRRTISVPDLIRMRSIGDPAQLNYVDQDEGYFVGQWENGHQSEFSPDGKHVAIIVRWGDLAANLTRAQIWVYDTRSIFSSAPHRVVVRAASSSNRPPIQGVRWLADNRTIAYLAEKPNSLPQVFLTDTKTDRTSQVTHSKELISAFDITPSGRRVVFLARSLRRSETSGLSTHGNVEDLNLTDILTHEPEVDYSRQLSHLFVQDVGRPLAQAVADPRVATLVSSRSVGFLVGRCNPLFGGVSISPDGKYAVRICTLAGIPESWARFQSVTPQFYAKPSTVAVSV
jgi:dipeptidyl aminopeptidase/acylaminoacyl peptidase